MTSRTDTPLRTATLQFRVAPAVKYASRDILHRIGLTMTEAVELFLQRMIVDQKLPFEVVALDEATMARTGQRDPNLARVPRRAALARSSLNRTDFLTSAAPWVAEKKNSKRFFCAHAPALFILRCAKAKGEWDLHQIVVWLNKAIESECPFSWLYRAIFYASRNNCFTTLASGSSAPPTTLYRALIRSHCE